MARTDAKRKAELPLARSWQAPAFAPAKAACWPKSNTFYEFASARFGYDEKLLTLVQAFHFKGGQGAKTGTGGHLPGKKVIGKIAEVRGLPEGTPAVSPATFTDLETVADFRNFSDRVREISGGIPLGSSSPPTILKMTSASPLKRARIISSWTAAAGEPARLIFRDHISVPTIAALARARRHLDELARPDITLIVTGGLRTAPDFIKAMALGADGVALANSAIQAVGCVGARICNTNNCPAGVATQDPKLRARLDVEASAEKLARFLGASVDLMKVMARACGHDDLQEFNLNDLTTWKRDMAELSGVRFGGVGRSSS